MKVIEAKALAAPDRRAKESELRAARKRRQAEKREALRRRRARAAKFMWTAIEVL